MEKSLEEIEAEIARLRDHVADYLRLAAERRAAEHFMIAEKITEAAAGCEKMVSELERQLAGRWRSTSSD
jgi:enhancing lycopene biosynthesis protein 2